MLESHRFSKSEIEIITDMGILWAIYPGYVQFYYMKQTFKLLDTEKFDIFLDWALEVTKKYPNKAILS